MDTCTYRNIRKLSGGSNSEKTLKHPDIEFNVPTSKLEIKGLIKKSIKRYAAK